MNLLGWFRRKPAREIFPYWDGSRRQWADPLAVHRTLEKEGGDWQGLLRSLELANRMEDRPDVSEAVKGQMAGTVGMVADLAKAVRKAFRVLPLNSDDNGKPVGLSDAECLSLLADYLDWLTTLETEYLPLHSPPKAAPLLSAEVETGDLTTGPALPCTLPATA